MGTQGYKVYRCNGIYMIIDYSSDGYPSWLGRKVLEEMQGTNISDARKKFLETHKEWVELYGEDEAEHDWPIGDYDDKEEQPVRFSTRPPPAYCFGYEWIYTIDLDLGVLHINTEPVFSLLCLPPPDDIVRFIGYNHYRSRSFSASTPMKHRWDTPFLELATEDSTLSPKWDLPTVPITELFQRKGHILPQEDAAIRLAEFFVANCIIHLRSGLLLMLSYTTDDWKTISLKLRTYAYNLIGFCISPMIWVGKPSGSKVTPQVPLLKEAAMLDPFWWPTPKVVVHLTPQLQIAENRRAGVDRIKEHISGTRDCSGSNSFYGVLFDIVHIVLLRVDCEDGVLSVVRTSLLLFSPSMFATAPGTAGITALTLLGRRVAFEGLLPRIVADNSKETVHSGSIERRIQDLYRRPSTPTVTTAPEPLPPSRFGTESLPLELHLEILQYLDTSSMLAYAATSRVAYQACLYVLRSASPQINECHLIGLKRKDEIDKVLEQVKKREASQVQSGYDYGDDVTHTPALWNARFQNAQLVNVVDTYHANHDSDYSSCKLSHHSPTLPGVVFFQFILVTYMKHSRYV